MLSGEERLKRDACRKEFHILALKEEVFWKQRSRIRWLKEGDRNTKFFHKVASQNKNFITIHCLWINGKMSNNQMEIRSEVESFHTALFKEEHLKRPLLEGLEFDRISNVEKIWLERKFSEEVLFTIKSMKGDKSPGSNGFTISFFQRC